MKIIRSLLAVFIVYSFAASISAAYAYSKADCIQRNLIRLEAEDQYKDWKPSYQVLSRNEAKALPTFNQKVSPNFSTFALIPADDCEFKAIFNHREPTQSDMTAIAQVRGGFSAFTSESDKVSRSSQGLTQFIENSQSTYLIFVGHNENGLVYFPDGSISSIPEIADACDARGKRPIFLSCNSDQYIHGRQGIGVDSALTYKDAFDTLVDLRLFFDKLSSTPGLSYSDLATSVDEANRKNKELSKVAVDVVVKGGKVIALVIGSNLIGSVSTQQPSPAP
jgi:hypothetical protein